MTQDARDPENVISISRRNAIRNVGVALGAAMLTPRAVNAQTAQTAPVGPPSTITQPPRDFSPRGAPTTYFTDPDVLTVGTGSQRTVLLTRLQETVCRQHRPRSRRHA